MCIWVQKGSLFFLLYVQYLSVSSYVKNSNGMYNRKDRVYRIRCCKKAYSYWLQNSMYIKDCRMTLLQNSILTIMGVTRLLLLGSFYYIALYWGV